MEYPTQHTPALIKPSANELEIEVKDHAPSRDFRIVSLTTVALLALRKCSKAVGLCSRTLPSRKAVVPHAPSGDSYK